MVLYAQPISGGSREAAAAVLDVAQTRPERPIVACFLGNRDRDLLRRDDVVVPEFPFPEEAALALARVARYGDWRREPLGELPTTPMWTSRRRAGWSGSCSTVTRRGAGSTRDKRPTCWRPMASLPYPPSWSTARKRRSTQPMPSATRWRSRRLAFPGWPRPRPAASHSTSTVTRRRGRRIERMCEHLGDAMEPALVQAMAEPGIECLIGVHRHPVLGDVMTLGPGGATAERLEQVALRILPLTDADAAPARRIVAGRHARR